MSSTRFLKRWTSRAFLRPSHHYIPCRKEEQLVSAPWGKVQLWREYNQRDGAQPAQLYFLRFLGSRGRAELATLDPADRLGVASEVWTMNAPGFGATTGPPELERYADCVLAAFDHLARHANGAPIWLCGKSIGTSAALLAAAQDGASGVILRNVMPLWELLRRRYAWRTAGLSRMLLAPAVPERLDCIANAAKAAVPALFLVSRDDRVSPPAYQKEVISAYRGPVTMLEVAGGHDDRQLQPGDEEAYARAVRGLLLAA